MKRILVYISAFALFNPFVANAELQMYVPTGTANDLVIIDLNTDKVTGRIPELENAHGLAASPNSDYLVAGSMQPIGTGVVSGATKPSAVSEAEHAAHHAAGSPESGTTTPSYVSIVHPEHGHVMRRVAVRGITHHTAVSPDGVVAIAVHSGAGGISVIDLVSMSVVKEVQTGRSPNYALFSSDGGRLYVSNAFSGTVSEINVSDWTVKRELAVGKEPEHMALSSDDKKLFVANVGDGQVVAVDLNSGKIRKRYTVGREPHGIDVSNDGRWLFVTSKGDGKLLRFDLQSGEQRAVDLQPAPYHLDYVDAVNKLYVSSRKEPKIWVIDPQALAVRGEIAIGKGVAHQMVILNRKGK
ncbi:MAG: beta-propeller fold lactonase family protein [Gammaproteobacteria bacterium]|nr:beta-propeller fold lactonase family protein [Gammaproteobacteria bacterium]